MIITKISGVLMLAMPCVILAGVVHEACTKVEPMEVCR